MSGGGRAFPVFVTKYDTSEEPCGVMSEGGLTKREFFAALALQGLLANPKLTDHVVPDDVDANELMASASINAADALVTELEKKNGN